MTLMRFFNKWHTQVPAVNKLLSMNLLEYLVTALQMLLSKTHNPSVLQPNHSVTTGLGLALSCSQLREHAVQEADAEKV